MRMIFHRYVCEIAAYRLIDRPGTYPLIVNDLFVWREIRVCEYVCIC